MNKLSIFIKTSLIITILSGCTSNIDNDIEVDRSEFDWQLVWSDNFESESIDQSKWNFVIGAGGYGNNELQYYSQNQKNARIEKGKLIIEAHKEDYNGSPYTSAKLTTKGKGDWTYGRYEIRAKLPEGQGIWPAFWMMPTDYDIYGPWPACGEIDIMEVLGHETTKTYGTLHYGNPYKYTGDSFELKEGSFSDSFHTFAIEWLPGEIRWYIDGVLFQVQDEWHSNNQGLGQDLALPAPFDRDFYMQFNLAVGGNWPGYPDESTKFPQQLIVDWIKVYESANGYPRIKPRKPKGEEAELPGREPQDNGNYVYNNNFSNGLDFWTFENFEGGSGSAIVEDGELHIKIKSPGGQSWANQLYQKEMNIRKGVTYNISFKAKSEEPRNFMLKIGGLADRGWAAYSSEITVGVEKEYKEYNYQFTMKEKTDTQARFEFNMGLSSSDMWLDDISLTQIGGEIQDNSSIVAPPRAPLKNGNLIYNGTFDRGNNRDAYWKLELDKDSDAMFMVTPEIYNREGAIAILDSSGNNNGIVLYQDNINLMSEEIYQLTLDAYAGANRKLGVVIKDTKGQDLLGPYFIDLTTKKENYKLDIPVAENIVNGRFCIIASVGNQTDKVVFDNISLIKVVKPIDVDDFTKIEAENYFQKSESPQTQDCSEGGLNVGWMTKDSWLKYRLNVKKPGKYIIRYRVASEKSDVLLEAESIINKKTHMFIGSGGWQNWETLSGTIDLPKGETLLTITGIDININWIELELIN